MPGLEPTTFWSVAQHLQPLSQPCSSTTDHLLPDHICLINKQLLRQMCINMCIFQLLILAGLTFTLLAILFLLSGWWKTSMQCCQSTLIYRTPRSCSWNTVTAINRILSKKKKKEKKSATWNVFLPHQLPAWQKKTYITGASLLDFLYFAIDDLVSSS